MSPSSLFNVDKSLRLTFGSHFLTAWSLTSDVVVSVQLPTSPKYMSARNKQLGIITIKNEILLWRVGGSIVYIERPELQIEQPEKDIPWSPEAILFHPLKQGHFFIFNQDWPGPGVLVQEFIEWRYHKTQYVSSQKDLFFVHQAYWA